MSRCLWANREIVTRVTQERCNLWLMTGMHTSSGQSLQQTPKQNCWSSHLVSSCYNQANDKLNWWHKCTLENKCTMFNWWSCINHTDDHLIWQLTCGWAAHWFTFNWWSCIHHMYDQLNWWPKIWLSSKNDAHSTHETELIKLMTQLVTQKGLGKMIQINQLVTISWGIPSF